MCRSLQGDGQGMRQDHYILKDESLGTGGCGFLQERRDEFNWLRAVYDTQHSL